MYGLKQTTAPTAMPLDLSDVKRHLRIDHDDEESYIRDIVIPAAVAWCEGHTGRQLMPATWTLSRDCFPDSNAEPLLLPKPPLASVTSIGYVDTNGDSQTWDAANYLMATDREPAEIRPAHNESWPSTRKQQAAVTVVYQAGYTNKDAVPIEFKQAMLLVIGHWLKHRESTAERSIKAVEMSAMALVDRFKAGDDFACYGA